MRKWTRNSFSTGPPSFRAHESCEIPPAVAAARARLGWSELESRADACEGSRERSPRVEPQRNQFMLTECRLVMHSGETLVRARIDAPWAPMGTNTNVRQRGSLKTAIEIAKDSELTTEACQAYDALVFAPGTSASKNALFNTWKRVCEARGVPPLPLMVESIKITVAILRSAGYRAIRSFLYEAKDRHIRSGYPWSEVLQAAVEDAKRVADRARGAVHKSDEVRPEVWKSVLESEGWDPESELAEPGAPRSGIWTWVVGTAFVLREVELSSLVIDGACITFDALDKTCTLKLPVSKTDPSGRGAARSLGCKCDQRRNVLCPVHAVRDIMEIQRKALGVRSLQEVYNESVPLISRRDDPRAFVEKRHMINEAQRHVDVANRYTEKQDIDATGITGHFMRRSGIKHLARTGSTFTTIQWFARHSSSVTWSYIEESWGECHEHSLKLKDEQALTETLSNVLGRVSSLEEAISHQAERMEQELVKDGVQMQGESFREEIRREARNALIPKGVINVTSKMLHAPSVSMCIREDPKNWATACGWNWVCGDGICKPIYELDDVELDETIRKCRKCFNIDRLG